MSRQYKGWWIGLNIYHARCIKGHSWPIAKLVQSPLGYFYSCRVCREELDLDEAKELALVVYLVEKNEAVLPFLKGEMLY